MVYVERKCPKSTTQIFLFKYFKKEESSKQSKQMQQWNNIQKQNH